MIRFELIDYGKAWRKAVKHFEKLGYPAGEVAWVIDPRHSRSVAFSGSFYLVRFVRLGIEPAYTQAGVEACCLHELAHIYYPGVDLHGSGFTRWCHESGVAFANRLDTYDYADIWYFPERYPSDTNTE